MKSYTPSAACIRSVLKVLSTHDTALYDGTKSQLKVINEQKNRIYKLKLETMKWLQQSGLVLVGEGGCVTLTQEAPRWVRRNGPMSESFRGQHHKLSSVEIIDPQGISQTVEVVDPESPLAWLMARKDKSGMPFLSEAQYAAGERLRLDYGRAALNPQMGMNWCANGQRSGGSGRAVGDANDASLDARDRVNNALSAVGPELSGPLVDVCCYLTTLSNVEKARNWPARSGKLILKLSLEALARHYGMLREARGPDCSGAIRHIASSNYQPHM
ncbi:MAG: DUF6456 domain-containing protein [Hyphomicrobiales bacterium]